MHIGLTGPVSLAPLAGLLSAPPPPTYDFPFTGQLARTWLRQGHRVSVYALSFAVDRPWTADGDGLTVRVLPHRPRARTYLRDGYRAERRALAAVMRADAPEMVSAHWTYAFALAAAASGRPAFVTAHDTPLRYIWETRTAFRTLHNSLAWPAVHRAHALSAVSPYTARHLRTCLGVRRSVEVIPNGIDTARLPVARAGAPGAGPVFASAANGWGRLKNTAAVLRALPQVRYVYPGARLLLFGHGHGPGEEAQRWARVRGLTAGVEFAGAVPHDVLLRRLAERAQVLVHPSRIETFSVICAEAMAMGLPVIAGQRCGGVPWVVRDAGLLTDVGDPGALAVAMLRLAGDPGLREQLGVAARARVAAQFGLEGVARAYTDWFGSY